MGTKISISQASHMGGEHDLETMPIYIFPIVIDSIESGIAYMYLETLLQEIKQEFDKRLASRTDIKYKTDDVLLINWNNREDSRVKGFVHLYKVRSISKIRFRDNGALLEVRYSLACISGKNPSKDLKYFNQDYLDELKAVKVDENIDRDLLRLLYE